MADFRLDDPGALVALRRRLGEFVRELPAIIAGVQREADETRAFLGERQEHWRREVERCRREVEDCESALRRCRERAKKDKNGGCGSEERALREARRKLAHAEDQLRRVERLIHRVDAERTHFEGRVRVMRQIAGDATPRAQARLDALHRAALQFLAESLPARAVESARSNSLTGAVGATASIPAPASTFGVVPQDSDATEPFSDEMAMVIFSAMQADVLTLRAEWANLTAEERLARLVAIETAMASVQGRPPTPVVSTDTGLYEGGYDPKKRLISFGDLELADPGTWAKSLDTILHEGRHAYQHHAIDHPGFHPDAAAVEAWRANFAAPDRNPLSAPSQAVEVDARAFAARMLEALGVASPTAHPDSSEHRP